MGSDRMDAVVAMSGGVDSSVAAALLKQQGYRITGVTMRVWGMGPSSGVARHACYGPGEETDIADARTVAGILGIPFRVIDVTAEYRSEVIDYLQAEYLSGRTPNPCSRCNRRVKFGALVEKARESGIEFDYFATGHYARVEYDEGQRRHLLKKALDMSRDQSYFLALLSREQVSRSLFPLGGYSKSEVRELASRFGLPVAGKADSQDFAAGGYRSLLPPSGPGPIVDREGKKLGEHRGIVNYTVGQRKGLGIAAARALYVTGIDPAKNTVVVGEHGEVLGDRLIATGVNWIAIDNPNRRLEVRAKIRYRHQEAEAAVTALGSDRVAVEFRRPQIAVTPGQTVVFYDGDVVLGGGTIERSVE